MWNGCGIFVIQILPNWKKWNFPLELEVRGCRWCHRQEDGTHGKSVTNNMKDCDQDSVYGVYRCQAWPFPMMGLEMLFLVISRGEQTELVID